MIFGNPDKFAIYIDIVSLWSYSHLESLAGLYLKGNFIFSSERSVSLYCNASDICSQALANPKVVEKIFFEASALTIIKKLLKSQHPNIVFNSEQEFNEFTGEDIEQDFSFDAGFESLNLIDFKVFAFCYKEHTRILGVNISHEDEEYFNLSKLTEDQVFSIVEDTEIIKGITNEVISWHQLISGVQS